MALPIAGSWVAANANADQYVGALRWGTGSNPVKDVYGEGPPLRTTGRLDGPDNPTDALSDIPGTLEDPYLYGYCPEDIGTTLYDGMPPPVGSDMVAYRGTVKGEGDPIPPWGMISSDPVVREFADQPDQSPFLWSGAMTHQFPTETVSEGWRNKTSGQVNDAETSDPSQYERQTSMQQVNPQAGRNNTAAVARATDSPRAKILTRLTGMKLKPWSQGERNQDMFPYQQDMMLRPFWYRTAGTDDPSKMSPNAMIVTEPVQRDIPPDPDLGPEETAINDGTGNYTPEDTFF